jgi:hypothetical protein
MIENVLTAIGGIGVYDAISICLFMLVFCGVFVWAVRLKKPILDRMSALPLEDDCRPAQPENRHE